MTQDPAQRADTRQESSHPGQAQDDDPPDRSISASDAQSTKNSDDGTSDSNTSDSAILEDINSVHANLKEHQAKPGVLSWLRSLLGRKSDDNLRQAIEDYIEETTDSDGTSLASHEKTLISNVLKLRDLSADDVMIPRADIISFDLNQPPEEFLTLVSNNPLSRIPVYKTAPDDIIGTVHIKDVLRELAAGHTLDLESLSREAPIVSPSLPILDLLLQMRQSRKHMVLVIDEFGGIDGLVTIGDLIETIVGEFYDEHDLDQSPQFKVKSDGTIIADARMDIEEFEDKICHVLEEEERNDIDTLGGLVFTISGRIPARGEILKHAPSGLVFEIIDADPRRIKKMRIQNIPR